MDWEMAIKRNSEALIDIVADLFALLGLAGGETISRIAWPAYRAVLRVLRPAESCVRRLIVGAARGLMVKPAASRPRPSGAAVIRKTGGAPRSPLFQLFDPQKRIMIPPPHRRRTCNTGRIHMFNADGELVTIWPPPRPAKALAPASADGLVNAKRLIRRLEALEQALADLPRQAKRLARWQLRQETSPDPSFKTPIRRGYPPGHRKRNIHEVDDLLSECSWLAYEAMKPDTS